MVTGVLDQRGGTAWGVPTRLEQALARSQIGTYMPIEMALWRLNGDDVIPVPSSGIDTEERLEVAIERDISILGLDRLLVIGRQVPTRFGKVIDLLALGPQGDVVIIELKRDRTPREVVAQALDYGSWVRDLDYESLASIFQDYLPDHNFDEDQQKTFGQLPEQFNSTHQLVVVASELDPSTERIMDYLNDYEVPINVVFFRYLKDDDREYLARSWLVDPAETEGRTTRKKRPWNGRDFYISFGEGDHGSRRWEDAQRYGFVSGGGAPWYSRSLAALQPGHRVFVHIPSVGYVGVGEVTQSVQPVKSFLVPVDEKEVPILQAPDLKAPNIGHASDDLDRCEYFVRVKWQRSVPREQAFWEQGLFANQNTAARLRDTHTIQRLEEHFGVTASQPA
jgi:hypothetical protein